MAFFTNFRTTGYVGLLDWYTVSVAVFSVVILAAHGATYLTLKTEGPVHERCARWAKSLWVAVAPFFLVISIETALVRPDLTGQVHNPFLWLGLGVILTAVLALISGLLRGHEMPAFLGSNFVIVGLLTTGAAAIFPVMLHSTLAPENSLTAYSVAASRNSLILASIWWPIALALAITYFVFISRQYAGKVTVQRDNQGFN